MHYGMQKETRLKQGKIHSLGTKQASAVFPDSNQGLRNTKEKGDLVLQRPSKMQ